MLEVVQVDYIRWLHERQGKSIRQIARELGHSRKTVRKALGLTDVRDHKYTRKKPTVCPVTDPVKEIVKTWLQEDKMRPLKQRHTAHRIYERLVEEYGFQGGESTVRRLVAQLRDGPSEVHIPLAFNLGQAAQCDWGEAQAIIAGEPRRVYLFCMRLCASRVSFVTAFLHQKQEAFFKGHRLAFEFFGGVPQRVIYDNLRTAVQKILKGTNRREQEAFVALRSHYLFQADFCNAAQAHEKGQVENLVGYARRNFLVPVPECASLTELNQLLYAKCLEYAEKRSLPGGSKSVAAVWAEEKKHLLPLPPQSFACCRLLDVKSDSYARVRFENNFYSVPTTYARRWLTLKAFVDRIEVYGKDKLIASHPRLYGRGQEHLVLDHYLDELLKKPRALLDARPFKEAQLGPLYQELLTRLLKQSPKGAREFVNVLRLGRSFDEIALKAAIEQTLAAGDCSFAAIYEALLKMFRPNSPEKLLSSTPRVQKPNVAQFNELLRGYRADGTECIARS